jgi:hypothetical protein
LAAIGKPPTWFTRPSFYTSTNAGAIWISNNVPVAVTSGHSLVSSADGCKLAVMSQQSVGLGPLLLTSTNSGANWMTNNLPGGIWRSVALSADGTRLIVAGLGICLSTNFGGNWTSTNSLSSEAVSIASSADGAELAAICGQLIFVSTNVGVTWVQTSAPRTNWISIASSADGSKLVAAATGFDVIKRSVVNGPIYTSTNSGMTWVSNSVPAQYWTSVASSADGNELAAVVFGGGIWVSQSTPAPQLNIATSNTNLDLSWIVPSTSFVMQQSSDLGSWADMTNTPALNLTNLQNEVILSPIGSSGFYRLKTP